MSHNPCAPFNDLVRLGFASVDDLNLVVQTGVREGPDVRVHRGSKGPYFLSFPLKSVAETDYVGREDLSYWKSEDYDAALAKCKEDDARRAQVFRGVIRDAGSWLDFGTGLGGVVHEYFQLEAKKRKIRDENNDQNLNNLKASSTRTAVIEVQNGAVDALKYHLGPRGVSVYRTPEDIPITEAFDVVTLFHVMEHLDDPIGIMKKLREKMKKGAKLIVEVPHANDALVQGDALDVEAFRQFTFWSEHLILHTRESLKAFIEDAGFVIEKIEGYQRYPLANHVGWLRDGKPGGHNRLPWLRDDALDAAYAEFLDRRDMTDTIIACAFNP